jgi:hypothetical protein
VKIERQRKKRSERLTIELDGWADRATLCMLIWAGPHGGALVLHLLGQVPHAK